MLFRLSSLVFFFFKQKTAYEMRISDWSSDVCSSDLMDEVIVDSGVPGVSLLPCGAIPPSPAELLVTPAMDSLLATVRERYDTVLIDAPPVLGLSDACLLASKAQEIGRAHV